MNEKTAYPLCWPDGRPRTAPENRRAARFKTSFARSREKLIREINLLGGDKLIFSSDIPCRLDGLPYADLKPKNGDPGVACYFTRKGKQLCFACDLYLKAGDNLHAIELTVSALRGIARWGTGDMMESAFRGYAALPQPAGLRWWETLGVPVNAPLDVVREAYRMLAKKHHPDMGGDAEMFRRISEAWKQCEGKS